MSTQTPAAHKEAFCLMSDEIINRRNLERIPLGYSPDGEIRTPNGTFKGIEKITAFYQDHHTRYPNSCFLVNQVVAEGDVVAAFCTFTAIETIKPDGLLAFSMPLRMPVTVFTRFDANGIVNQDFVWDNEGPRRKAWLATVVENTRVADSLRIEKLRNKIRSSGAFDCGGGVAACRGVPCRNKRVCKCQQT